MNEYNSRVIEMAYLMLEGRRTVREVAKIIGYSKSTVHHDLTTKLEKLDPVLYNDVKTLLEYNKKSAICVAEKQLRRNIGRNLNGKYPKVLQADVPKLIGKTILCNFFI